MPGRRDAVGDGGVFGQPLEHRQVDRFGSRHEPLDARRRFKVRNQRGDRIEARLGLAPENVCQRREAMFLDRVDFVLGELRAADGLSAVERAEGPVLMMASGAAGDLRHLGGHRRRWRRPSNLLNEQTRHG